MLDTILDLAARLDINVFELGSLALFTILSFLVSFVLSAFRKTEVFRQYEAYFRLIDDVLYGAILAAQGTAVDLAPFEQRVEERHAEGLVYIDPRMLYVLERAEGWAGTHGFGNIDFEETLTRAEGLYQTIKVGLE